MRATRRHFGEAQLVEVGIGCEACHLGSRAHADDPELRPTLEPRSALFRVVTPDGEPPTHAELVNHTCARCHTVLFSEYEWTWEGGHRDATAGGSSINSGEARDFLLGGCRKELACTACHDPHTEDSRAKLDALATSAGDATCARCHAARAVDGHSHHPGVGCIACHMPKKNMGLAYQLTRYHRIGSPDDPARVERDRPLECALCHTGESVAALVGTMERWWGKRYDRAALRRLYGDDLDVGALAATLARGLPHEQATAASALGDAKVSAAAPLIVPLLAHGYPLVRHFARRALEQIEGRPLPVDLDAPADDILAAARRWLTPP
jgi:predicted CXXCH cytochrome family protein